MQSTVFVYDPTINDPLSKVRGVGRYIQILRENFNKEFSFVNNLRNKNLKLKNHIFINPFFNFLMPPLIFRRIAKKQIAVIHDIIPLKYPEHFPAGFRGNINIVLNQFALRNYDVIITDSQASKRDIVDLLHVEENRVRVVYPTLPRVFSSSVIARSKATKQSKGKIASLPSVARNDIIPNSFCLYVGDATWNKNLVNLAKAIKKINVTCVFVGKVFDNLKLEIRNLKLLNNPWQRELQGFIKETIGDKRFVFTGFLPDEELIKFYQQAKLNILPSQDEGFGFSYLEAASLGCPSVLSNISVLNEISERRGVVFTDPKNPEQLANAIGEIYFNTSLRQTLGSEAKQRSNFFSINKFRQDFLNAVQ